MGVIPVHGAVSDDVGCVCPEPVVAHWVDHEVVGVAAGHDTEVVALDLSATCSASDGHGVGAWLVGEELAERVGPGADDHDDATVWLGGLQCAQGVANDVEGPALGGGVHHDDVHVVEVDLGLGGIQRLSLSSMSVVW